MPKTPKVLTVQRSIRLPGVLWERLESWMEATERETRIPMRHSDAIRALLERAIEADELRRRVAKHRALKRAALEGEGTGDATP